MARSNLTFLTQITQVAWMMLMPILGCVFLGLWLDDLLQWSPWLTLGGSLLGIAAAFRNLLVWSARMSKIQEETVDPLQPKGEKLQ
jgi:F0F1-type ATP synthase assembly protein I